MFNLFNKSKVRAGKQNNEEKKPAASAGKEGQNKKQAPFAVLGKTWAKLNKMDRKQAYTWGAIAVVVVVALITLGSAVGSNDEDNFYNLETRGYDLANMPFSSDEAEQYLLASKYPDMQNTEATGLYSDEEKKARQAEDAEEAAAELDTSASTSGSQYIPGRYYGGGAASAPSTQVGTLNSASLKGASGSGISGTFGPTGDFSNFKSQEKGRDVFNNQQTAGSGDARKALFQSAVGSRAAAGQKDSRLLNAKKAMMGGNVKGSDAFLSDSGAVDLSKSAGLNLDPNAPVSSVDPGAFNDALNNAKDQAEDEAEEEEDDKRWEELAIEVVKMLAQLAVNITESVTKDAIAEARANRAIAENDYQNWIGETAGADFTASDISNQQLTDIMGNENKSSALMDQMDLKFQTDDSGNINKNVLMRGDDVVARKSGNNWEYEPDAKPISVTQKDASKINKKLVDNFESNNKELCDSTYKSFKKQAAADRALARQTGGRNGPYYPSYSGDKQPTSTIMINDAQVPGKLGSDGKTFTGLDGQKYKYVTNATGDGGVWQIGN